MLLVLTRKVGESITFGDVTVTVIRLTGKQVRLAIDMPDHVRVLRGELSEREITEKLKATEA